MGSYLTTDDYNGEGKRRGRRDKVLMAGSCCVIKLIIIVDFDHFGYNKCYRWRERIIVYFKKN